MYHLETVQGTYLEIRREGCETGLGSLALVLSKTMHIYYVNLILH